MQPGSAGWAAMLQVFCAILSQVVAASYYKGWSWEMLSDILQL